jgi:hypothetical protein
MGFVSPDIISSDANMLIPEPSKWLFGILESRIHMAWMRYTCGRLETRIRYSADVVYNNFPWMDLTDEQKVAIDKTADAIEANNRFSPDKITINIKNLICEGKPFAPSTIKSVTNTAAEDQLVVWCNDYMQGEGYIPVPDTILGKLPKIFVDGVEIPVDVENAGE